MPHASRWLLIPLLITGCQTGTGSNVRVSPVAALTSPAATVASARAGTMLAPGLLAGRVGRFDGKAFQPAAGVEVVLGDGTARATTDAEGLYGFANVPAGVHQVKAATAGHHPYTVAYRQAAHGGIGRVNLALVPTERPAGLAADQVAIAGVLVDPRGAALPAGTVRLADSLTTDGNRAVTADADGFWAVVLGGVAAGPLTNGQATLTAFGTTPGEVKVESTEPLTLPLDGAATHAVVAATSAYALPRDLRWVEASGRRRVLAGTFLPTRRDELVVRWARPVGYSEGLPTAVEGGRVVLEVPPGYDASDAAVELLPLGLVPPAGKLPALSLADPVR